MDKNWVLKNNMDIRMPIVGVLYNGECFLVNSRNPNDIRGFVLDKEIEPLFSMSSDEARSFKINGLLRIDYKDGHIGYINDSGKVVFELDKDVVSTTQFEDGLLLVVYEDGHYGYVDKEGKKVIELDKGITAYNFCEDLAPVVYGDDICRYINKKGKVILELDKDITFASSFCGGLAVVQYKDKHWGFIDKEGRTLFKSNKKVEGLVFQEDLLLVFYPNGDMEYINNKANVVFKFDEKNMDMDPEKTSLFFEGLAWVTYKDGHYSCIDKTGKIVFEVHEDIKEVRDFLCGSALIVNKDGSYSYIDTEGLFKIDSSDKQNYIEAVKYDSRYISRVPAETFIEMKDEILDAAKTSIKAFAEVHKEDKDLSEVVVKMLEDAKNRANVKEEELKQEREVRKAEEEEKIKVEEEYKTVLNDINNLTFGGDDGEGK